MNILCMETIIYKITSDYLDLKFQRTDIQAFGTNQNTLYAMMIFIW